MASLSVRVRLLLWLALLIAGHSGPALAQEEPAVRAAMIFNLLKFTTWPDDQAPNAPLRVCLIESSQEFSSAMQALHQRSVGGHPLDIQHSQKSRDRSTCDIIATDAAKSIHDPAELGQQGLLTIGDGSYIDRGGMIGIVKVDNKIRFEINATEMQRARINLSSKALQLAIRVR